jgi:hypothetical protein
MTRLTREWLRRSRPAPGSRLAKGLVLSAALALVFVLGRNRRSLGEGLVYLRQAWSWDPEDVRHIHPAGAFGMCHELVHLSNAARQDFVVRRLRELSLTPTLIPIPGEPLANVLARFGGEGSLTLFVAHYDKSRETPDYHAASDNTAAVCALLAAARDLANDPPARPAGLLFTGAEERGLKGGRGFVSWARGQRLAIAEVVNFDMIGRGRRGRRPAARFLFLAARAGPGGVYRPPGETRRALSTPRPGAHRAPEDGPRRRPGHLPALHCPLGLQCVPRSRYPDCVAEQ